MIPSTLPANQEVIESSHTERQSTFLIRTTDPILDPAWTVEEVGLEDLVLAYMGQAASAARQRAIDAQAPLMIWLSWRQFRAQAAVVFGVLAVVAIVLALTGPHLVSLADGYLKVCRADKDCGVTNNPVLTTDPRLESALNVLVIVLPALIGIFWGAPLIARELETGTYRLSWTQSVTRTRWLAVKIGVVGLVSVAVAGLFSLMVTWWSSPIDRANLDQFGSHVRAARHRPHRVHGLRLRRRRHRRGS